MSYTVHRCTLSARKTGRASVLKDRASQEADRRLSRIYQEQNVPVDPLAGFSKAIRYRLENGSVLMGPCAPLQDPNEYLDLEVLEMTVRGLDPNTVKWTEDGKLISR